MTESNEKNIIIDPIIDQVSEFIASDAIEMVAAGVALQWKRNPELEKDKQQDTFLLVSTLLTAVVGTLANAYKLDAKKGFLHNPSEGAARVMADRIMNEGAGFLTEILSNFVGYFVHCQIEENKIKGEANADKKTT